MTKLGVFLPVGNRGWILSSTSPKTDPSFSLNKSVVQRAEFFGFDFGLAMIKHRGFGGVTRYWEDNLEAFTLISALAAVSNRLKLYASISLLTVPPPVAARMAMTIDSVAPGRFGVNIVTGWQPAEYTQMGLWPGDEYFKYRYDYATEYVRVMKDLWTTGKSNFKGRFFQMEDCRLGPLPSGKIDIVAAGTSDRGMQFVAEECDYNFVGGGGKINEPEKAGQYVERLALAQEKTGRDVSAYTLMMIITAPTDEQAFAKWQHYKDGADLEALAWSRGQSVRDLHSGLDSTAGRISSHIGEQLDKPGDVEPVNHAPRLIGSYENVAKMLDQIAERPGIDGIMLIFDDFIIGFEEFGQHVQPLMKSRVGCGSGVPSEVQ